MTINVGDRVGFRAERIPKSLTIDPPDRDETEVPWREYFAPLSGVVDALDAQTGQVRVRGRDLAGHAYTVWVEPGWLSVEDPAEVE